MALHKLPHYLRHHRKRAGLSQDEVAWLLGAKSGTKISRYERFNRRPALETAFAYEILFGVPASEIFAGIFETTRRATLARVEALIADLRKPDGRPAHGGRKAWLEQVAAKLAALQKP